MSSDQSPSSDSQDIYETIQSSTQQIIQSQPQTVTPPMPPVSTTKRKPLNLVPVEGQTPITIKYQLCSKQGLHQDQYLNLVCLDKGCIQNSSICGVCMEQSHKNHNVRPLKLILEHARRLNQKKHKAETSASDFSSLISDIEKEQLAKHEAMQEAISAIFEGSTRIIKSFNHKIQQQLDTQLDQEKIIEKINLLEKEEMEPEAFSEFIRQLKQGSPSEDVEQVAQTEEDMVKNVQSNSLAMSSQFEASTILSLNMVKEYNEFLAKTISQKELIAKSVTYQFDKDLKHESIALNTPNTAKSTVGGDYNFALLGPELQQAKGKVEKFAFKVVNNFNNWVAVGICHKKTVQDNQFKFSYSTIEHGGYLISSNAGSWSSLSAENNNSVKAFKFKTGDTIFVFVDFAAKTVTFEKKKLFKTAPTETYSLEFQEKKDDPLHLCALFYYKNDEIEFLGKAEDNGLHDTIDKLPDQDPTYNDPGYYSYDDDQVDWEE